jgi:hypothetical protein
MALKRYTIRTGAAFRTTNEEGKPVTLTGGDKIDLEDDVAAMHADKLELDAEQPAAEG